MRFSSSLAAALLISASYASETATETAAETATESELTADQQYLLQHGAYEPQPQLNGKPIRGDIKKPRRQPAPKDLITKQPEVIPNRTDGRKHDWRDYEPNLYGGKDPYASCDFSEINEMLDTPQY